MLGIFKNDKYVVPDKGSNSADDYIQPPAEPKEDESAFYTIGLTPDGRTQITFGQNSRMQHVLSMDNVAVAHLIKLLAVNISDDYIVTVNPAITPEPDYPSDFYR